MDESLRSPAGTLDADEAAMRRSLGLDRGSTPRAPAAGSPQGGQGNGQRLGQMQATQARARHRFRQDGEVQIEIAETGRGGARPGSGHQTELEQLRMALQQERATRERAEHALQQARDSLRTLQTQIAHTDMTHREAIAAEQRARDVAEHALADMRERLAKVEAAQAPPRRGLRSVGADSAQAEASDDAQPVQWWLPGWKGHGA